MPHNQPSTQEPIPHGRTYPNHQFDFGDHVRSAMVSGPITAIRDGGEGWDYQISGSSHWIKETDLEPSCPDGDAAQTSAPCARVNQQS
jgi:hypothetical protein